MTPKSLVFALTTLVLASQSWARDIGRELERFTDRNLRRPPIVRPNPPQYPGRPYPRPRPPVIIRPPVPPVYPDPIYDRYITRSLFIGRFVNFETLSLDLMLGLYNYRGYRIESVQVETTNVGYNTNFHLLTDGLSVASVYSGYGVISLFPLYTRVIGYDFNFLQLQVQGAAYIGNIYVRMVRDY